MTERANLRFPALELGLGHTTTILQVSEGLCDPVPLEPVGRTFTLHPENVFLATFIKIDMH